MLDNSNGELARSINRVMVVVSLAVGSAFILVGGYWVHRLHLDEFIFNRATAQGQVVENRKNLRGRTSYKAMVRFNAHGGGDVTVADWIALNPASFSVGQNVTLFYDPEGILGGVQGLRRILVEKGHDAFPGSPE